VKLPLWLRRRLLHVALKDQESAAAASERIAALEAKGFEEGTLAPTLDDEGHADWTLDFCLRLLFFVFALLINTWWSVNVRDLVWQSGRTHSGFHLSDKVLVVLLTTSIANYIALLSIIARYLYRSSNKKAASPEPAPVAETN
jgi:hypothetical protein